MIPDPYAGTDLLADVFEDTEDAPEPLAAVDAGGNLRTLYPATTDRRWKVEAVFRPDGTFWTCRSIRPRVIGG